jgi:hypothetical protein
MIRAYRHDIGDYMRRWILQTPLGTLRLHHIMRPDDARDFHDHPWSFVSLVVWGWYIEERPGWPVLGELRPVIRRRRIGGLAHRRATDLHAITHVAPGGCWTAVISGPRVRRWGFQTPSGWVYWRDYTGDA